MIPHRNTLYRVETTATDDDKNDVYFFLAQSMSEAVAAAEDYCEEQRQAGNDIGIVFAISVADGDLIVEGEDPDGEEDDVPVPGVEAAVKGDEKRSAN